MIFGMLLEIQFHSFCTERISKVLTDLRLPLPRTQKTSVRVKKKKKKKVAGLHLMEKRRLTAGFQSCFV